MGHDAGTDGDQSAPAFDDDRFHVAAQAFHDMGGIVDSQLEEYQKKLVQRKLPEDGSVSTEKRLCGAYVRRM